jgi:4-carboxymuconolactone decarboxylase
MKKIGITIIACIAVTFFISCNSNQNKTKDMETTSIFPKGAPGSSDYFTGIVHVQGLVNPDEIEGLYSVGSVTFEPSGKTNWHTHPAGQILLVTEGNGFYQERGKPAQVISKGSVVKIPKDVEHWHGASKNSKLVHIAISNMKGGSNVTWMNPVNDEEYSSVNK